jgi:hypothetical protein
MFDSELYLITLHHLVWNALKYSTPNKKVSIEVAYANIPSKEIRKLKVATSGFIVTRISNFGVLKADALVEKPSLSENLNGLKICQLLV